MNTQTKLSPERYLQNKAYFDSGLISTLETVNNKPEKSKDKILILDKL